MKDTEYSMHRPLPGVTFDEAIEVVTDALKEEGFGVLTRIDVAETLKTKIGADFRPYVILGACNPPLAHGALQAEPLIGLLLPCNVVVMEEDDGSITVSAVNPAEMFKVVDNPELQEIAGEVDGKHGAQAVPRGGMGTVMEAFQAAARDAGVTLRMGCAVDRIVVANGRATGANARQSSHAIMARMRAFAPNGGTSRAIWTTLPEVKWASS